MSDLRSLSAPTSEEGSRPKHERLHRPAVPDLHLRGGRQDRSGYFEANHSSGDVQYSATGRGGTGSGEHDCQNHEGSGSRLIGWPLSAPMARVLVIITPDSLYCSTWMTILSFLVFGLGLSMAIAFDGL